MYLQPHEINDLDSGWGPEGKSCRALFGDALLESIVEPDSS